MSQDAVVKKFVPKRRTPYLMQEEVIRERERSDAQLDNKTALISLDTEISSQLAVKKESISSHADSDTSLTKVNFHDEVLLLSGLQKK